MPIVQPNARVTGTVAVAPQRGGIVNPNGTVRKNGRPIQGTVLGPGLASHQHATLSFAGRTYNSPFTDSGKPLFNASNNNSTQLQLPALQVEAPGDVVATADFVKVHPTAKGTFFRPTAPATRPVAFRAGGPSKHANTPANPNAPTPPPPRVKRSPQVSTEKQPPALSFLRSGGTLSAHANHDSYSSRWSQTKKGAANV